MSLCDKSITESFRNISVVSTVGIFERVTGNKIKFLNFCETAKYRIQFSIRIIGIKSQKIFCFLFQRNRLHWHGKLKKWQQRIFFEITNSTLDNAYRAHCKMDGSKMTTSDFRSQVAQTIIILFQPLRAGHPARPVTPPSGHKFTFARFNWVSHKVFLLSYSAGHLKCKKCSLQDLSSSFHVHRTSASVPKSIRLQWCYWVAYDKKQWLWGGWK